MNYLAKLETPPELDPRKRCPYCAEPVDIVARRCSWCGEYLDPILRGESTPIHKEQPSRLFALFLSLLIPGLGQIYRGQYIAGLGWLLLTLFGYAFYLSAGLTFHALCALAALL